MTVRAAIFALTLAFGSPAYAESPFDGRWVDDLDTQMGQAGFDTYLVSGGTYRCSSCHPAREYPADGKMRPVADDPSIIAESVSIAGPRTIVTHVVDHEMERETTMTVAPDGRTATYLSLDRWPGHATPLRTEYVARRIAPAPANSNAVSGSWQGLRYVDVPVEYRSVDLAEADGRFTRTNFRHGHYTATIGGPAAPVTGDGKNIYQATVRAPDAMTRIETILLNGKPLVERSYRLSEDGKTMTTTVRNPADNSVFQTTSRRK